MTTVIVTVIVGPKTVQEPFGNRSGTHRSGTVPERFLNGKALLKQGTGPTLTVRHDIATNTKN